MEGDADLTGRIRHDLRQAVGNRPAALVGWVGDDSVVVAVYDEQRGGPIPQNDLFNDENLTLRYWRVNVAGNAPAELLSVLGWTD